MPSGTEAAGLPYRHRDDFLSPAELSFYHVLRQAVGSQFEICPKVNLWDLFFVARPNENRGAKGRIDRKHVDFVLCEPRTMRPVCAIELDDRSHQKAHRRQRDAFVDEVFATAGVPLLHVAAARSYSAVEISSQISELMQQTARSTTDDRNNQRASSTQCPKCGSKLVQRMASKGPNQGQPFLGCSAFPKCRHTEPVAPQ
ncbi:MAG: DUF2726 domain-containing protein [Planctomycetaceae bacterium]|nr:DUF2726 domain-containing protein [Planctomycetaceae bacterium]